MEQYINTILKEILNQLYIELKYNYQNLNINQDLKYQFQKIAQKKLAILYFITILFPEDKKIQYKNLGQDGYTEIIEKFFEIPTFDYISLSGFVFKNIIDKVLELISKLDTQLDYPLEYASPQYLEEKSFLQQYSLKTREIASRFSQIFHYLSCINEKIIKSTTYENQVMLSQKCCILLEIVLSVKLDINQNTQLADILLRQLSYLLKEVQIDHNYLLRLDRVFNKLTLQLDNSPPITFEYLRIIHKLLDFLSYHLEQQIIQPFLINSLLCKNLKIALKHHITITSIDDQNQMIVDILNEKFLQIFQLLYEEPLRLIKMQDILSKVIQEISSLYQLTLDSYHKKVGVIFEFLLSQIQSILNLQKTEDKFYQMKGLIELLKQQFQQNILKFPIFYESQLDKIEIRFDQIVLFKYLQQAADQQFNLKLNFEGIEFENQNSHPWSILPILKLLSIQEYSAKNEDLLSIQFLKLLEVLLQQSEICANCTQALKFTLTILIKLLNNNSEEVIVLLLKGIKKIFELRITSRNILDLCNKILINIFSSNRFHNTQFIQQMLDVESLFKVNKFISNQNPILQKFYMAIIYDKTLLKAQIEAKIKKIIFDQEYDEEIKSTNYDIKNLSYNIKIKEQLKIQKNNPSLMSLQNDEFQKEEVREVMNLLFIESVEEQCFILKNGIRLDTLNSIYQNGDSISQINFKHTKETQILLKNLVQQIVILYFDNDGQDQSLCQAIFDVLQNLVSVFPLLLPTLLKKNCSQFLQPYKQQIGYEQSELPTQISFITLITKYIIPSYNFIFYICLNNLVLFRNANNVIVPFGNEIRRITIKQLYNQICKSIKTFDQKLKSLSLILVLLLQIKSVAKICIKNSNEPQDSFNFINLYIEGIKRLDWRQYFIQKNYIFILISTLNLLYIVATCLLLEKNQPTKNQMFTSEEIEPFFSKFHSLEQPLFSVGNLQESNQIENEFEISNDQLHFIKEGQISPEKENIELEDEVNQFIDENIQENEGQSLSNLKEVNILPQILYDNNLQKSIGTIQFFELIFPDQFQKQLNQLQNMLKDRSPIYIRWKPYLYHQDLPVQQDQHFEIEWYDIGSDSDKDQFILQQHQQYRMQEQKQINHKVPSSQEEYQKLIMQNIIKTLKNQGKIDRQFIKCLCKMLCVDNFRIILDTINNLIKNLTIKLNISDLVIDELISLLKQTTQNVFQEFVISSKNEPVCEFHNSFGSLRKNVLNLLLDLQQLQQCNLSTKNISELMYFTELFNEEQLTMLFQVIFNSQQLSTIIFSKDQIQNLFYKMQKEKNEDNSNNFIKCISYLLVDQYNRKTVIKLMKKEVEQITQQNLNQLLNENTIGQISINSNGIEKIFQILEAASRLGKEVQYECEQFLNSPQIYNLMKFYENAILMIPKQQAHQYNPALESLFNLLVRCHQFFNSNNHENTDLSKLASMEFSRCNSDSVDHNFQSLSKDICEKGKFFINITIKQKLESLRLYRLKSSHLFVNYFLKNHSSIIDFEIKQSYFYLKMKNQEAERKKLEVRREQIFEDSYEKIRCLNPKFLGNIRVDFFGEQGQDEGGLSQEWISLLTKEIVNENNKLFNLTSNLSYYQINRESNIDPDHLNKFYFIGQIIAIAIFKKLKIYGRFPASFFKHIVGQKLSIFDIQHHDEELYTMFNLIYHDNFSQNWGVTCSQTILNQGVPQVIEFIPGGQDIEINQQNKKDILRKYCHQIMAKSIENQMHAFLKGFYSVIPKEQISIFDSTQLEQLLCGSSDIDIDVEDLILNFEYNRYTPTHQVILWLQNTLRNFSQDLLTKFLKFITAYPLMPLGGFKNLKQRISISLYNYGQVDIDQFLPVGHTCSYELDLPPYSKQEILAAKLQLAITEGGETFSLQ